MKVCVYKRMYVCMCMYVCMVGTNNILAESCEAEYGSRVEEHRVNTRDRLRANKLGYLT